MDIHSYINRSKITYNYSYPCENNECYPYKVFFPPGIFRIKCWGAQGGNSSSGIGGKGAFVSGIITFTRSMILYFYIGNSGFIDGIKSYNGGGDGSQTSGSGGGSTDIRLNGGLFDDFESLKSRIMVAGGGGGASFYGNKCNGADAGGLTGYDGFYAEYTSSGAGPQIPSTGGSQIKGGNGGINFGSAPNGTNGSFGIGGDNTHIVYAAGGGGGYYGGGGATVSTHRVGTGAGGSSYISGHLGCNSIKSSSTNISIQHTGNSIHYTSYYFIDTVLCDGKTLIQSPYGYSEIGHTGQGFVEVTVLQFLSENTNIGCSSIQPIILLFFSKYLLIMISES